MIIETKINGWPVLVDYDLEYDKDFDFHYCRLNHVWKILPDDTGKNVKVDILSILHEDYESEIKESIEEEANQ